MKLNNNKGFSLIELMVVVAIIGILAAVGVPQYSKFQAKARQGEAKATLSALYTAESSFFIEWNQYSTDMRAVGMAVVGTNLRYTAGFNANCNPVTAAPAPAEAGNTTWQVHLTAVNTTVGTTFIAAHTPGTVVALNSAPACVNTVGSQTFLASATGDPRSNPGAAVAATWDTWQINNSKSLSNTIVGL